MDEKINIKKVIKLLYQEQALDKHELADIGEFLRNPGNLDELNSYLDETPENSSTDIKLKVETIWEEIRKRKEPTSPFKRTVSIIRKYAAILLLPLLIYTSWVTYLYFFAPEEYFTLVTQKGEQTNIILPDGSSAWLNVDTRITYNTSYGKKYRKITVMGEAFFDVKKNPEKPFIVHVQNMEVKALGTAFNVRGYADGASVQTSLFEGKVDVSINNLGGDSKRQILTPGQSLIFNRKTDAINMRRFKQETVGAWIDKQLIFENTPFDEVIKNTERWFNVEITFGPVNRFENDYLTLRLKKGESLEHLLEIIDETIGINYKIENHKIILTKKQ